MSKVTEMHRRAMELAERATLAKLRGEVNTVSTLIREAFEEERRAAMQVVDEFELEPTRSVLYRSAASLAIECGENREAEKLIGTALSGNPPEEIAKELRDLLEQVYFNRHLSLRGITLQPNEFQVSLAGKLVGFGITHSEEFIERVRDIETLIYRTAERKRGLPFRERGRRKGGLQKEIELYVSVPRAASFAVSLRIGSSPQLNLPGMDFAQDVVDEIFGCLELFSSSDVKPLQEKIKDPAYYRNFIALSRKIAPDGREIRSVGFTATRGGQERKVILSIPCEKTPSIELGESELVKERVHVRGTLLFADARKEGEGKIQLIDDKGSIYKVHVPTGMMSDIVRPMWEYEVLVTGTKERDVIMLETIERVGD